MVSQASQSCQHTPVGEGFGRSSDSRQYAQPPRLIAVTEQQKYDVVRNLGKVELRRYAPCVMADIVVRGDYRRATYEGFGPLVTYISRNDIAMTAPVVQEGTGNESWRVSFVMPTGTHLSTLPRPANQQVTLREVPEHLAAALRFSGLATRRDVAGKEHELLEILRMEGLTPTSAVRVARFDPPWTPSFMRHNELVVDVAVG